MSLAGERNTSWPVDLDVCLWSSSNTFFQSCILHSKTVFEFTGRFPTVNVGEQKMLNEILSSEIFRATGVNFSVACCHPIPTHVAVWPDECVFDFKHLFWGNCQFHRSIVFTVSSQAL